MGFLSLEQPVGKPIDKKDEIISALMLTMFKDIETPTKQDWNRGEGEGDGFLGLWIKVGQALAERFDEIS